MGSLIYRLRNLRKRRGAGGGFTLAVPSLELRAGELLALVGPSGCGKSTLLDLLAMALKPDTGGEFEFCPRAGAAVSDLARLWQADDQDALARLRGAHLGYVLQTGGLLGFLSVRENLALTRRLLGLPSDGRLTQLASELGIGSELDKKPAQLSVGQRQRVAIGRALAHGPAVILADEPTASLDPLTADKAMAMLVEQARRAQVCAVIATHDWQLAERYGLRSLRFHLARSSDGLVATVGA